MSPETFMIVVTVAVWLACLAFVIQAILVFSLYKRTRQTQLKVNELAAKAGPVIDTLGKMVHEAVPKFARISDRAVEISDQAAAMSLKATEAVEIARRQMDRVEELLTDVSNRAKAQVDRIDTLVEDTVDRVHETTAAIQGTVMRPVREVSGIVAGVKTALSVYKRGQRPSVDHVTQDEEMFI
ncbi:MAG: hypothetical protein WD696_17535 [Bryobacteraceae bacterium]